MKINDIVLSEAPKTAQAAAAQADIARQDAAADAESDRLAADFNKRQATMNKLPGATGLTGATNTGTPAAGVPKPVPSTSAPKTMNAQQLKAAQDAAAGRPRAPAAATKAPAAPAAATKAPAAPAAATKAPPAPTYIRWQTIYWS